jgi:hypothetical protein
MMDEAKITTALSKAADTLRGKLASGARAAITYLAGFAEIHAEQSMTRLLAFLFGIVGCVIGLAGSTVAVYAVVSAYKHGMPAREAFEGVAGIITQLGVLAGAFITSGAVALLIRSKHDDTTAQ